MVEKRQNDRSAVGVDCRQSLSTSTLCESVPHIMWSHAPANQYGAGMMCIAICIFILDVIHIDAFRCMRMCCILILHFNYDEFMCITVCMHSVRDAC